MIVRWLGQDKAAADYIGAQLGIALFPPYEVLGCLVPNGDTFDLRGGYVLNGKSAANIDVTLFGRGCLTRLALWNVHFHIFYTLQCQRATARCRRSNLEMRGYMRRIGWVEEGVQRRYWGPTKHDDAVVYGMLPGELKIAYKREFQRHGRFARSS